MKLRWNTVSPRRLRIAGTLVAYVLILAVLLLVALNDGKIQKEPVFGSVESLYVSDIILEHQGEKYYYRENENRR